MRPALLLLALLTLAGCAGYQLGTSEPAVSELRLAPVVNQAFAPQAAPLLHDELTQAFARGGKVRVVKAHAAPELRVTLLERSREAFAGEPDDSGRKRAFDLTLAARVELERTGEPLDFTVEVSREAFIVPGQSLIEAERETLALLVRALAQEIHHRLANPWEA